MAGVARVLTGLGVKRDVVIHRQVTGKAKPRPVAGALNDAGEMAGTFDDGTPSPRHAAGFGYCLNQLIMYNMVLIQLDGTDSVPCHSFSNRSSLVGMPRTLSAA